MFRLVCVLFCFSIFANCFKVKILRIHMYISADGLGPEAQVYPGPPIVHLWQIHLIGRDLGRRTPVSIRPHGWPCTPGHEASGRSVEVSVGGSVLRLNSEEGCNGRL